MTTHSQSDRSGGTDLAVAEPDKYPPQFDAEIVKAIHWCRLGRVRPDDEGAFHRAKEIGLLAQDVWRATERGEGVLVALGLLEGRPAPQRTLRACLWAVCDRYPTPHLVTTWSEWQWECGDYDQDAHKRDWQARSDDGPWRFFTTFEHIDLPEVPDDAC